MLNLSALPRIKEKTLEINPDRALTKSEVKGAKSAGYDLAMLARVQPQGGLLFKERYAVAGDGYFNTISITKYPADVGLFWLAWLTNNPYTIASVDIKTASSEKELAAINRTLDELSSRANEERKTTDRSKAADSWQSVLKYANDLNIGGEIAKAVRIRIFVYAPTREELETRTTELRKNLKAHGFGSSVYLFEQESEFRSLNMSYDAQDKMINAKRGQSMPAATLGKGIPFHYQSLQDPLGFAYGTTDTGGTFIWDQFRYTKTRRSFNGVVLGMMGYGKSTLLKMIEEATVTRGNMIRIIDKVKEYETMVKKQGGLVINLDGTDGRINPWEVYATITDKNGLEVNERSSFAQTLANLTNQISQINRDFTDTNLKEIRQLIRMHYEQQSLIPKGFMTGKMDGHVTGKDPNEYPTYRTFLNYITQMRQSREYENYNIRQKTIEDLQITITDLLESYGAMFDGPSTIRNLSDEPIVCYDISSVANLEKNIFQVQIGSALQLIWSDALKNGRRQNYLYQQKKIDAKQIRYFNVLFDECHNLINANNPAAVEYVSNFEREMRKFRAGVLLATQSPQEMIPEGAGGADIAKLKTVFELTQYKILFKLDESIMGRMHDVLGDSLNESEYAAIGELERGHAIVSMGSKQSYRVNFEANKRQLDEFGGQ